MKPSPAIGVFKPDEARAIKRKVLGENYSDPKYVHGNGSKLGWYYGILTEELLPATNPLTGYTSATVNVLMYTEGTNTLDMEEVTDSATVYEITNRSPNISGQIGDVILFRWIIKEWVPVWGSGSSSYRHGIVISSECNGYYTIELGVWGGDPGSVSNTSAGSTSGCDVCSSLDADSSGDPTATEPIYPTANVIGLGEYVTGYHRASTIVPLRLNSACLMLSPSGDGASAGSASASGSASTSAGTSTVWQIVDGLQEHVVQHIQHWECCNGVGESQEQTLISITPIMFAAIMCPPIIVGSCSVGSGSGSGSA